MGGVLNYRRWLIVGYLLALMWLSFSILFIPGEKYHTLTTSDSGWVYDCAVIIENTNALAENNPWSHAPYGLSFSTTEQMQPLIAVIIYRGLHTIAPSITLLDVTRFYASLLFSLTLIPVFLTAREFKGNLAGCISAFLLATMIPTIYWHKFGAFDREPTILLMGAWTVFFLVKVFKADKKSLPSWVVLGGLTFGLFMLTWAGAPYMIAVGIFGLLGIFMAAYIGGLIRKFPDIVGAFIFAVRTHLPTIAGLLGVFFIVSLVLWALGGQSPIPFWKGTTEMYLGAVGIQFGGAGAGGVRPPATEAAPVPSWEAVLYKFYSPRPDNPPGSMFLTTFILLMIGVAFIAFIWKRRRHELLVFSWLLVLLRMVWPGVGQARFERIWWAFIPVVAGIGIATVLISLKDLSLDPSWEWLKKFQNPLLLGLLAILVGSAFVFNAYHSPHGALYVTPPTEWHGRGLDDGFMETFEWIRNNTPEGTVFSIQWSFGHLFTGATSRATVVDGCETMGAEGEWEEMVPRPPDYIYYVEGGQPKRYGVDALRQPYKINGRRVDVEWFPRLGSEELAWYLKTYRDEYGVKIDYFIFSVDEYTVASGFNGYWRFANWYLLNPDRQLTTPSPVSPSFEDNELVFNFGGNRTAVVFNRATNDVYLRLDGERQSMGGFAVFTIDAQGTTNFVGFTEPRIAPIINEILVMVLDERGNVTSAWLAKGTYGEIAHTRERIGVQAFEGTLPEDHYLEKVFASSNNYIVVLKVDHEHPELR